MVISSFTGNLILAAAVGYDMRTAYRCSDS
jgi:hypothetical protein